MSSRGTKDEIEKVSGGLPPATPSLFAFCSLIQWAIRCERRGFPEKYSQPPHNKVAATALKDVWIIQELACDQLGAVYTPLYLGVHVDITQDQCATPAVGGQGNNNLFPVGTPQNIHKR